MVRSAALLMRERGVDATSFSEVLALSGAPRGSIYHYFPGGKAQLVEEATRYAGDFIGNTLSGALKQDDPMEVVDAFAEFFRPVLYDSDYAAGCPIAASALEGDRNPGARDAAGDAFRTLQHVLSESLRRNGVPKERARSLATVVFASLEGAIILARAERSAAPLDRVVTELQALIREAVPARLS
jgi:AcrR family transcriptional regulator